MVEITIRPCLKAPQATNPHGHTDRTMKSNRQRNGFVEVTRETPGLCVVSVVFATCCFCDLRSSHAAVSLCANNVSTTDVLDGKPLCFGRGFLIDRLSMR